MLTNIDYDFSNQKQITIRDKDYVFKALPFLTQIAQDSVLYNEARTELQALVNDGVTAKDIATYLETVKKVEKEAEKKQEKVLQIKKVKTTNSNLEIYFGIVAGVIFLIIIGAVITYCLIQKRKLKKNSGEF